MQWNRPHCITKCCGVVVLVFHRHHVIAVHGIKGLFYRRLLESVMSTNIRIFKYSNKMALKYYFFLHSCHFPSTNISVYSFVDFRTTKYIRIFIRKFLDIQIYLNICSEHYFNICLAIFNEKSIFKYNLCIQKYPV